jgi:hypothetical protein
MSHRYHSAVAGRTRPLGPVQPAVDLQALSNLSLEATTTSLPTRAYQGRVVHLETEVGEAGPGYSVRLCETEGKGPLDVLRTKAY